MSNEERLKMLLETACEALGSGLVNYPELNAWYGRYEADKVRRVAKQKQDRLKGLSVEQREKLGYPR